MLATRQITITDLRRQDAAQAVLDVFAGLSAENRRLRFHAPMSRLPDFAVRQLAAVDGRNHAAVVASVGDQPVGIARFARLDDTDAEIAVEVVDAWQGHGIGGRLLEEVRSRAAAAGYHRLVADVLPENAATLAVLMKVFPDACLCNSYGTVHVTTELATATADCGCDELSA